MTTDKPANIRPPDEVSRAWARVRAPSIDSDLWAVLMSWDRGGRMEDPDLYEVVGMRRDRIEALLAHLQELTVEALKSGVGHPVVDTSLRGSSGDNQYGRELLRRRRARWRNEP
jgi:hypothetical protein